MIKNELKFRG